MSWCINEFFGSGSMMEKWLTRWTFDREIGGALIQGLVPALLCCFL